MMTSFLHVVLLTCKLRYTVSQQATQLVAKILFFPLIKTYEWLSPGNVFVADEDLKPRCPERRDSWVSLSVWRRWLSLPAQVDYNSAVQRWVILAFSYLPKASSFDWSLLIKAPELTLSPEWQITKESKKCFRNIKSWATPSSPYM